MSMNPTSVLFFIINIITSSRLLVRCIYTYFLNNSTELNIAFKSLIQEIMLLFVFLCTDCLRMVSCYTSSFTLSFLCSYRYFFCSTLTNARRQLSLFNSFQRPLGTVLASFGMAIQNVPLIKMLYNIFHSYVIKKSYYMLL